MPIQQYRDGNFSQVLTGRAFCPPKADLLLAWVLRHRRPMAWATRSLKVKSSTRATEQFGGEWDARSFAVPEQRDSRNPVRSGCS